MVQNDAMRRSHYEESVRVMIDVDDFSEFCTDRLQDYKLCTGMWGSNEAVEAMALTIVEIETMFKFPDAYNLNPRIIIETYCKILKEKYPKKGNQPLHLLQQDEKFGTVLFDVLDITRQRLQELHNIEEL